MIGRAARSEVALRQVGDVQEWIVLRGEAWTYAL